MVIIIMTIANFVMEIGLESGLPTYSGGLGILAGDYAFSLADLGVPAVYVTLLYKKGYTVQRLDRMEGQIDSAVDFDPGRFLTRLEGRVEMEVGGRPVRVGAWEYRIKRKVDVPVLFLDTDLPDNDPETQRITDRLYGGDLWHRLSQEMVLGIGGYRMLKALGHEPEIFHLNEGHAALLTTELLRDHGSRDDVRKRCVFTTHTPVAAGYDVFPLEMVRQAFEHYDWIEWGAEAVDERIDLSRVALRYSGVTNAVSLKHRYVSESLLRLGDLEYVTNGVYHRRWVHNEIRKLYDQHFPGWEQTPSLLAGALDLPTEGLSNAHLAAKSELISMIRERTGVGLSRDSLTIVQAKRVAAYKRNNLILADPERLVEVANRGGPIQIVFAGKTHPADNIGKAVVRDILGKAEQIASKTDRVRIAYLENYDMDAARLLVAGCDLWLNNPTRPLEACGTSGMKAAMNGIPNFSVYDGWWLEGGIEGVNGWGIGRRAAWADLVGGPDSEDLEDMYNKLMRTILPSYYQQERDKWWHTAKCAISTILPHFNSYRMVEDYLARVYARSRLRA